MTQKWFLPLLPLVFLGSGVILASCATDNGSKDNETTFKEIHPESEPTYLGREVCLTCHEDRLRDLPKNKHWQESDIRTPAASEHGCETCHGPGSHHMELAGESETPGLIIFGKNSNDSAEKQNGICLNCHQADVKHWQGSLHDTDDMSCVSCHSMHTEDRALSKVQEQTFCYSCHQNIRSETYRPYRHPIREELISCTDFHGPHGSVGTDMLNQLTLNDN